MLERSREKIARCIDQGETYYTEEGVVQGREGGGVGWGGGVGGGGGSKM